MTIMQAPPGSIPGQTFKFLSGTTYTLDASLFTNITSQIDVVVAGNAGFRQVDGRGNFVATVDPAVGNDGTQDYAAGSLWINTTASPARAWICVSAGTGAAVWLQISIGSLIATANSATIVGLTLSGLITRSSNAAVTAFSGGGQSSATLLTTDFSNITTAAASSAPYDSVKFNALMSPGQKRGVANNATNPAQLFGFNTDTINGFASGTGVTLPAGFVGTAECYASGAILIKGLPTFSANQAYNTNTSTTSTTLTGANISGGVGFVVLNMTGTLGSGQNITLPTAANLAAAIPNAVAGLTYVLRIINSSSANFAWTLANNSWTFNVTTTTIAQNNWRDYLITLNTLTTATIQALGGGTLGV